MAQRRSSALPADPFWYRDAVIYQLHVKAFFDSNNDGVGDFPGLIQRLDYLAELGINAVWLLPFYPSPRRDDGYDISDYRGVHPEYGTIADVRTFIREAHARGIRVITELVINHTSDQHPWFQKARHAKPGSPARDFYVWSDTDKAYAGTRIIFLDTEKSNWTWDDEAQAYYWHRFYAHQPDLNFDNPRVLKSVISVMRFWLDMGVDGLRLDAVPYLVEREGTSSENLPETHAILKHIRKVVDDRYPDRMLLAEANQWPEDIQEYFGAGDECHMVFHFPLMPRMYMAIAQEDRFPITDIIRQTPDAPPGCQWAIFLRNHDELTLEMVTDRERDYLWQVYAADRRARLNLGIRRRLAPLLENDRRRIELMNSLLLTMPGTPILYYGDEIGMGDNIHLGDRDGVRTPMQWSSDRNGGFSRADPASLVLPTIMDPIWGYQAVNVEAQWRNPHSLLNWVRRMLVERSRHQAFGRGTLKLLLPQNRKVLAYLREHEDDTILCVVNVSRSAQAVELDLHEFAGRTPIELLGGTTFPAIGRLTYLLTLPPYGFYWFKLSSDAQAPAWSTATAGPFIEHQTLVLRGRLAESLDRTSKQILETGILPVYMAGRRWFQQKGGEIGDVGIVAVAPMPGAEQDAVFADVEVSVEGERIRYALPMSIAWEDVAPAPFEGPLAFARARRARHVGLLTDGFASANFAHAILQGLSRSQTIPFDGGEIVFLPLGSTVEDIPRDAEIEWPAPEQSNSSLVVGRRAVVKLFRRVTRGVHPEPEMARVLTERGFTGSPALIGEVVRRQASGETSALAVVETYVSNQGDGSRWTHEQLARIIDAQAVAPSGGGPEAFEPYWAFARALGYRVGEMHAILAEPSDDPAFSPETVDAAAVKSACVGAREQLKAALKSLLNTQDRERRRLVAQLAARRDETLDLLSKLLASGLGSLRTRIHGDLHLGQVLVCGDDVSIIDFEGEPLKPLDERRAKRSPMRDVAGMVRSFDYATRIIERERKLAASAPGQARASELLKQFRTLAEGKFLDAYGEGRGRPLDSGERQIVKAFAIEKAAYEIVYEVNNRPDWVDIPLRGLAELLQRGPDSASG
ncbi:MAG TPA: maltose alpha-D-glucosyltransferase [Rhizomicrobium sp.]|jgi:maltose alpha-D-glucosyltransferase/alpha-amylase|nr:maltose alpha-D-glucosyltransferase [Rhizomicrobium sp.]